MNGQTITRIKDGGGRDFLDNGGTGDDVARLELVAGVDRSGLKCAIGAGVAGLIVNLPVADAGILRRNGTTPRQLGKTGVSMRPMPVTPKPAISRAALWSAWPKRARCAAWKRSGSIAHQPGVMGSTVTGNSKDWPR